jgi:hypothetical protein
MRFVGDAQVVRREPNGVTGYTNGRVTGHNASRDLRWRVQQG